MHVVVTCWLVLQKHFKRKYTIQRWLHPHYTGPHQINSRMHTYIKDSQPIFIFEWVQAQLVFQNLTHSRWPTLPLFVAELQDPLNILLGHWVVIFQRLKGKHKAQLFIHFFIYFPRERHSCAYYMTNGMQDLFLSGGHAFLELSTRFFQGCWFLSTRAKTKKKKK